MIGSRWIHSRIFFRQQAFFADKIWFHFSEPNANLKFYTWKKLKKKQTLVMIHWWEKNWVIKREQKNTIKADTHVTERFFLSTSTLILQWHYASNKQPQYFSASLRCYVLAVKSFTGRMEQQEEEQMRQYSIFQYLLLSWKSEIYTPSSKVHGGAGDARETWNSRTWLSFLQFDLNRFRRFAPSRWCSQYTSTYKIRRIHPTQCLYEI